MALTPAAAQKDTVVKKEKRIIIIKEGSDSSSRDTIEFKGFDTDEEEITGLPKQPATIVSGGSLDFGFSNVSKPNNDFIVGLPYTNFPELNNGKSLHIGLENNWGFNLIKGKMRLWMGLRYDINNYRFNNPDTRLLENQPAFISTVDSMSNSTKSKVVVNYIGVPIALGYQSDAFDAEDGFYIKAGVNAGYRVRVHTKVKLENGNKEKGFDDFNFNDFALTPFVMLGYNNIGLYARYTTTPLFKEGEGQEAYAFQFGLVFQ